jgi:hypothetical protein
MYFIFKTKCGGRVKHKNNPLSTKLTCWLLDHSHITGATTGGKRVGVKRRENLSV